MDRYKELLQEKLEAYKREKESKIRPNILLLGRTGCGKSSLVNKVFPAAKAEVSDVRRGTATFHAYSDGKINLIDSRGYEMDSAYNEGEFEKADYHDYVQDVTEYLKERAREPETRIHIVWFCISIGGERVEDYDRDLLRELCHISDVRRHVAVVLTKCDMDDYEGTTASVFRQTLQEDGSISHLPVYETSTQMGEELLQLKELITWSAETLNEIDVSGDLKDGFVAAQMEDLDSKWDLCIKMIKRYAATAAGIGAVPVPFSDAFALTAEQTVMCAHIISIYNLDALTSISKSLVGDVFLSNLGKTIAGSIMKILPGAGPAAGGAINAVVASTLTAALGLGVSAICKNACEQILKGQKVDFDILFTFDSILQAMKSATPDAKTLLEEAPK